MATMNIVYDSFINTYLAIKLFEMNVIFTELLSFCPFN